MKPIAVVIMAFFYHFWLNSITFANDETIFRESYWVDEGRVASLYEAQSAKFSEFEGAVALGYSPHALWIKLTISGRTDVDELAVVVRPAFLRQVDLFDPEVNGLTAPPVRSGRDAAIQDGNHVGLDNGFVIPSSAGSRDIYLRITTTTSLTADVTVLPVDEATRNSLVLGGFLAVYFAFLLGFCLWSIVAWVIRRDTLYGLFALRQLHSSAHIFVFFGSLRFFLSGSFSAEGKELIYAVVTCTVASVAGYFDVRLISEFGGSRWLRRFIYVLLCLPAVTLTYIALGQVQMALQIASLTLNVQMLAVVALAFSADTDGTIPLSHVSVWLVRSGYMVMTAVIVLPMLMYQNVLHTSVPLFKILFLHAVISTIILFAILSIRNLQRDLMAKEARLLVEVQGAELQKESSRRVEKERFISMLTHELRNPLSVIQMLRSSDPSSVVRVQKAAQDMANVIERVEQSERIDSGQILATKTAFDLTTLVRHTVQSHSAGYRVVIDSGPAQMVLSDPGLVQRIFDNLLDNAAKYSPQGSEITVKVTNYSERSEQGVLLQITNEVGNAGTPDPNQVFAKYYRAKRAHQHPGSGLGLFLVANWVNALGGTINYAASSEPRVAQSVTFSVWMPQ